MAIELLLIGGSPYAWRVQLALEHKRIDYTTRVLSMSNGDLRSPEFLALNPRGRVPVLRDGELVVSESLAILAYLERRHPHDPIFGETAEQGAAIWRIVSEYTSYVDPAVEELILPIYFGRAAEQADTVRRAAEVITRELATYERMLAQAPFLAGDAPTAADFVVFPHVQSISRAASKPAAAAFELPFSPIARRHPAIGAWIDRIAQTPGYERTYPPNWR